MPTGGRPRTNAPDSPDLTALHAVLAFLVTVLVNLVQVKFQGKTASPFETHPCAITLAVFCLLFYCSLALVAHLSLAPDCCDPAFPILMMLAATLSVASLTSLLVRRPLHSFPYILSLVLLSMLLLSILVHVFRPRRLTGSSHLHSTVTNARASSGNRDTDLDPAPDVPQGAHQQHTPGKDFQICNRGSSDSGSSTATSDSGRFAGLQLGPPVLSSDSSLGTPSVATAVGDGQIRLEMAGDGGESVGGGEKSFSV